MVGIIIFKADFNRQNNSFSDGKILNIEKYPDA